MGALFAVLGIGLAVIAYILGRPWWRRRRRRVRASAPFPEAWASSLQQRLPIYRVLPPSLQQQLHGLIGNLIAEKQFVGCAGLQVDDEIRLIIAAQAGLLLLNRDHDLYPEVQSILVYPDQFFAEHRVRDAAGVLSSERRLLSGESWEQGKVIVSWRDVTEGAADANDGYNVVLHEFAHALDHETGGANGMPLLPTGMQVGPWQQVFSDAYERLCRQADAGEETVIDPYGAESPAEFFAVATESFFELPRQLQAEEPALYQQLSRYYRVDPVQWLEPRAVHGNDP